MSYKSLIETDPITRKRLDNGDYDYHVDLCIKGVRIGATDKTRWHIEAETYDVHYDSEYVAELLEKVIEVMRA